MSSNTQNWLKSRKISERIVIEGILTLQTPTSLSNGDADWDTDISLLRDSYDGKALLTGTSIAGALRNYMREYICGYEQEEFLTKEAKRFLPIVTRLFGSLENDGEQSHLIVDDALQRESKPETERRDGVRIDGRTRTAEDKSLFDTELLQAGTTFPLRFELLITNYEKAPDRKELIGSLALALKGFEDGKIHLGGRKHRGYGQCRVDKWIVTQYDLKNKDGLLAWLNPKLAIKKVEKDSIFEALKEVGALIDMPEYSDKRTFFKLNACFALEGSMLIRSASVLENGAEADSVHLRSKRNGKYVPILSGTSLAGVLRHRAVKICNTIANGKGQDFVDKNFVDKIFGVDMKKQKKETFASRLEVHETVIENTNDLIQTRIKIDRFTGGAYEGALFDAAPVFSQGKDKKAVEISLLLRSPKCSEIGLLLLLLKDLWTSDLAIGGESSIGRGRLKGIYAHLEHYKTPEDHKITKIKDSGNGKIEFVDNGQEYYDSNALNKFVTALNNELQNSLEKEQSSE